MSKPKSDDLNVNDLGIKMAVNETSAQLQRIKERFEAEIKECELTIKINRKFIPRLEEMIAEEEAENK